MVIRLRELNYFFFLLLFSMGLFSCMKTEQRPNIIYILADDLGYGELGVYGQGIIETPHIDAMASTGIRFTQHYSGSPVCAPSRSVLMTGLHSGHTHIRGNDEWGDRGDVWSYEAMFNNPLLEGQRPLLDTIVTVAEILKEAGYQTGAVGKWGLGAPSTEGVPNKQGFDFFYGYNCQRQAHTYYPMHLWRNEEREFLHNKMVPPHTNLAEGDDPDDSTSYNDFILNDYAPELIHNEAMSFIERNTHRPFFLYYASLIPHLPLQAPRDWVDYYRKKLGAEDPYTGKNYYPNQTPRATYAAMISTLDEQVGEIVKKLKDLGLYENTLIIFTSDNGPTYTGGADTRYFKSSTPFKAERGWSKGYLHEGGIRVPMIASWPGRIAPGTVSDHLSVFYDVMPTLCEIVGQPLHSQTDGISFLPVLLDKGEIKKHEYLYWEFPAYNGQQAVRMGRWKGIRKDIFDDNLDIELFDLDKDKQEQNNVAANFPDVTEKIETIMEREHVPATLDRFKISQLGDY